MMLWVICPFLGEGVLFFCFIFGCFLEILSHVSLQTPDPKITHSVSLHENSLCKLLFLLRIFDV